MSKTLKVMEGRALVVGSVHSPGSLRRALALRPGSVDVLELRVDHFAHQPAELLRVLPKLKFPLLLTVRHPLEGGVQALTFARRRALFTEFLPQAAFIDVELRSVEKLDGILALALAQSVQVIVSNHHFRCTPKLERLESLLAQAVAAGADIFKLAALASSAADVSALLGLLARPRKIPLSVMGMGSFGKVSRLLLAKAGSVLNYGYLDKPNASGQWEATLLKTRLAELADEII